jgi:hypothetical protein
MRAVAYDHSSLSRPSALGGFLLLATGRNRLILLKKSAMVSTVEKYALEIEIFTLSRGFRAQISRSGAQKRRFQQSVRGQSGRTDFFNRIGQKQAFKLPNPTSRPCRDCRIAIVEQASEAVSLCWPLTQA